MLPQARLSLKEKMDGTLVLAFPLALRLLLGAIAALVAAAFLLGAPEGTVRQLSRRDILPLVILALTLLGALYVERWVFDRPGRRVIYQIGLLPLRRTRVYPLSELRAVELHLSGGPSSAGGRGRPVLRAVLTLSLRGRDGSVHRLETYRLHAKSRASATAVRIAEACGLPMVDRSA